MALPIDSALSSIPTPTLNHQSEAYRDMLQRVTLFNAALRQQRAHRLPFIDGATHVAQMPSHLYRQKWERLPADNPHQLCRYVSLRWKKRKLEQPSVVNDIAAYFVLNGRTQAASHTTALAALLRPVSSASNSIVTTTSTTMGINVSATGVALNSTASVVTSTSTTGGVFNASNTLLSQKIMPDENSMGGASWHTTDETMDISNLPMDRFSDDSDTEEANGMNGKLRKSLTGSRRQANKGAQSNRSGPIKRGSGMVASSSGGITLKCEYCHMVYRSKTGLTYHVNTIHRGLSGPQARIVNYSPVSQNVATRTSAANTTSVMSAVSASTSSSQTPPSVKTNGGGAGSNASSTQHLAPPQLERGSSSSKDNGRCSNAHSKGAEDSATNSATAEDGDLDEEDEEEDSMPPPTLQLMVGGDDTSQHTSCSPPPGSPSSSHPAPLIGSAVAGSQCDPASTNRCDICQLIVDKSPNASRRWVTCSDCGRVEHCDCLKFTPNMEKASQDYPWQCIECKTCWVCLKAENDEKMLFCDDCDRGYHLYCLKPPLNEPPEGNWSCSLCSRKWQRRS